MSRKIRVPKQQIDVLPSPAWTFWLLAGRDPECRLPDWVTFYQAGMFGEATAEQIEERHRDALIEEARRHDFEPYFLGKRRPKGDAFERWRVAFLAEHRY